MFLQLLLPVLLQVQGGSGILQDSIEQLDAVQAAWDERWNDIFGSANGLYLGINEFAAIIFVGTFIFFAAGWIKEAVERGIFPALPHVIWILVIAALLYNNGALLSKATLGIRNVINEQTQIVLDIQVGDVTMLEALNDVVISQQAKVFIQRRYADCESKEGQAQVDCFIEAGQEVEATLQREYKDTGFWPPGVQRLWARVREITQKVEAEYDGDTFENPLVDILLETVVQTANQALAEKFLKSWQWAFSSILELSMLLTGLLGPIAVAGSAIPMQGRPLWAWLTGFFSLGMAKFSYNVIVGLAATVVVAADAQTQGDFGFLLLIGVLAPVLALALAGGAGMAVFRGVSGGVTRIISVGSAAVPLPR